MGQHHCSIAILGFATAALTACATARPDARCYPHMYLDTRYELRGAYSAPGATPEEADCYRFIYQNGRLVRVDYRRGGMLSADPSGIATIRLEYSQDIEKRMFLGTDGRPVSNPNGIYAVQLKRDGRGNPVEWRNFGAGGQLMEDRSSGVAVIRWRYDAQGQMAEESHFGPDERLKADARRGVAIIRWRYDRQGNSLEESYFGVDNRPTTDRLRGVAAVRWAYGSHGKVVEESYFGSDGRRTEDKNRGVAIVRWEYDADWNTVEERYLGPDERAKGDRRRGAAVIRWQYDRYGRETGTMMFDQDGMPMRDARN